MFIPHPGPGPICTGAGGAGGSAGSGGAAGAPPPPPMVCEGTPPPCPLITDFSDAVAGTPITFGTAPKITGGTFSYAGTGLTPPSLSLTGGPAGAAQGLQVAANPGATSDPANTFFGFGLFFNSCVDASAFTGVKFTIAGDLGNCGINFAATFSEDVSPADDPKGSCTAASCFPPSFPLTSTGTLIVPFAALAGGSPGIIDSSALVGVQWQMNEATGVACSAAFTITDVEFTNDVPPPPPPPPPPPLCTGVAPPIPGITGPAPLVAGEFTFAAPNLVAPAISPIIAADGSLQGLQVDASPGPSTDPANSFLGVGISLPLCIDASGFSGVQFTIAGDLGTCALSFGVNPTEQIAVAFGGACTDASCFGPLSGPLGTGTTIVRFADLTGGSPATPVDTTRLQGVQWNLTVPSDGVTADCNASFSITDVAFVP